MKRTFTTILIIWTGLLSAAWYGYTQTAVEKAKADVIRELANNGETTSRVCMAWWFGKPELSVKRRQYACR